MTAGTRAVRHIGELLTMVGDGVGAIHDAAILARDGRVLFAGTEAELDARLAAGDLPAPDAGTLDAAGRLVTPGLIDPHTHLVFAGDRADEFQQRHAGVSYAAIQASGGGIASTVRATRAAAEADLFALARERLLTLRDHGATTVEIKTGYGLAADAEERLLRVIAALARAPGLPRVVATFLGAHVVPPEYRADRAAYVALVRDVWLPRFAGQAAFCDVFCERTAFTATEARSILTAARDHGYRLKLHADQLSASGGAALAAELGAVSADHLDHATPADLARLAAAGVVAVLLPGCSLTLNEPYPAARRFLDHGLRVALATDCNPGTSYCENPQLMITLAVAHMGLTIAEALRAVTRNAAAALALDDVGILAPGARCDLALWRVTDHRQIGYRFGANLVERVVIGGV